MRNTTSRIIPMLAYEDGVAAIQWLCRVFGFTEKEKWMDDKGTLTHGEISMGNDIIMLASPSPAYQSPRHHRQVCGFAAEWYNVPYIINGILVYVDDVRSHFENAKNNGANILSGLEDGGPGLRYRVEDLEGQRWMFLQPNVNT